ncbi:hypothetical protein A374_10098 [Fictibacillus macauensis ZFHKF-1]|uniref:Uncharacterized protein n=1 Tax=Fictibacillus macauensis ZFHKF-1 TaxID=1196324 RepID=I8J1H4_9BACL|nr:hypothetical protein [Fictibacillus macauensis]EIT85581.1 hypothetical protein A374_10098 [Fictibacillus macauensis ZFHKF-1]
MTSFFKSFDPFKWVQSQSEAYNHNQQAFDPFKWLENHLTPTHDQASFDVRNHVQQSMTQSLVNTGYHERSNEQEYNYEIHDLNEYIVVRMTLSHENDLSMISLYQSNIELVVANRATGRETRIPLPAVVSSQHVTAHFHAPVVEVTLPKKRRSDQLREIHITMDQRHP